MAQTYGTDDLKLLLTFPFKDEQWARKMLIGSLILLAGVIIPILPILFVYGYGARILRSVAVDGAEPSLPEWEDWGGLLADGARPFVVGFIYTLPLFIVMSLSYGLGILFAFIPPIVLGVSGADPETVSPAVALLPMLGMFGSLAGFGLVMIFGLLLGLVLPATIAHTIVQEKISAGFEIRAWWTIFRTNLVGFLIGFVILYGLGFVLGLAFQFLFYTLILCCLTPFLFAGAGIYLSTIWGAIFGRAYRDGAQQADAPLSPASA